MVVAEKESAERESNQQLLDLIAAWRTLNKGLISASRARSKDRRAAILRGLHATLQKLGFPQEVVSGEGWELQAIQDQAAVRLGRVIDFAKTGRMYEVLAALQGIEDASVQLQVSSALSRRLAEKGYVAEALQTLAVTENAQARVAAMVELTEFLPVRCLPQAIRLIEGTSDQTAQSAIVGALAQRRLGFQQADWPASLSDLEKADVIEFTRRCAQLGYVDYALVLADTAPDNAPTEELRSELAVQCAKSGRGDEALLRALRINDLELRTRTLKMVAGLALELPVERLRTCWCEMLRRMAQRPRKETVSDLSALAPLIKALGGAEALAQVKLVIQEVSRCWN